MMNNILNFSYDNLFFKEDETYKLYIVYNNLFQDKKLNSFNACVIIINEFNLDEKS